MQTFKKWWKVTDTDIYYESINEAFNDGWRIERTSCMCGADWAWVKWTRHRTYKMFGCVCHHEPNKNFR